MLSVLVHDLERQGEQFRDQRPALHGWFQHLHALEEPTGPLGWADLPSSSGLAERRQKVLGLLDIRGDERRGARDGGWA